MKKIVSLLVAALLVLGACSFALAEEKTTIVIGATPSPHEEVLELIKERVRIVAPENCAKCGQCELRCPDYAIWLESEEEFALEGGEAQ